MRRIYESILEENLKAHPQMLFLVGPRQVGKTTISLSAEKFTDNFQYLNWDNQDHRAILLAGPTAVANHIGLGKLHPKSPVIVFDEIHKYKLWKTFIKGFYDTYKKQVRIIVTGSAKLNTYRMGGDSLMGRYFPYRVHPVSIAECLRTTVSKQEIHDPKHIDDENFESLMRYGGFPDPFLTREDQFFTRWKQLRKQQLFREDIRDLSRIHELAQLEVLAELLQHQVGQLLNYSNLANKARVSVDTIRRWIKMLTHIYWCFTVKPWTKNISRSLLKEPKVYLCDWSEVTDAGAKLENVVACHLLKAVNFWTDCGLGAYELYFLRDKEKREVDFLVTKNNQPWFIVEVKKSQNNGINPALYHFQKQTKAKHAFQVAFDMDYIAKNCFDYNEPIIVPAKTFLSQLV